MRPCVFFTLDPIFTEHHKTFSISSVTICPNFSNPREQKSLRVRERHSKTNMRPMEPVKYIWLTCGSRHGVLSSGCQSCKLAAAHRPQVGQLVRWCICCAWRDPCGQGLSLVPLSVQHSAANTVPSTEQSIQKHLSNE